MRNQISPDLDASRQSRELDVALARWVDEGGRSDREVAQPTQLQLRVLELHGVLRTLLAGVPVPRDAGGAATMYFSPRRARLRSPKAAELPPGVGGLSSAANDMEFALA